MLNCHANKILFVETGFIFLMQNISRFISFDFRGEYVLVEIRPDITLNTV